MYKSKRSSIGGVYKLFGKFWLKKLQHNARICNKRI